MTSRPDLAARDVTPDLLRGWPLPAPGESKEARGRVLVIGGSRTTPGAALLAGVAALRAGAGKLQLATARPVAAQLAVAVPEAMVLGLDDAADGALATSSVAELAELASDADAVLVGPGLTGQAGTAAFVRALVRELSGPLVLDALALSLITDDPTRVHHLDGDVVLTPNLDELAIMLGCEPADVERDPGRAARTISERARAVVSAGGPETAVVAPDGASWRDPSGNPGVAVSGSGDVQAGVVLGLLARGAEPAQAAVWASYLHGRAGDRLVGRVGPVGFLARELAAEIPLVLAELGPGLGRAPRPGG